MNMDTKRVWINALRSGQYKQARGSYRSCKGYCVFGVLLAVSNKYKWTEVEDNHVLLCEPPVGSAVIQQEFNITPYHYATLVHMNDLALCSFDEIASYIEDNL